MSESVMSIDENKSYRFTMLISFLMAIPLAGILLIHPSMILDDQGGYSHRALMFIMIGISGGFIHGVGFVPKFWLWKYVFSPIFAWPLMLYGYYIWFIL